MVNVKRKRALLLFMGALVMSLSGLMYVWTNYATLIGEAYKWTQQQLSVNFTIWNVGGGLGGLFCGYLLRRFPAKRIIFIGAVMETAGFILSSFVGQNGLYLMYITFGVLVGFGSGLTFIPVMNTVLKWYPDKPGYASGVMMFGLGIGTLVLGTISSKIAEAFSWQTGFIVNAIVIFVVLMIVILTIKDPGEGDILPEPAAKRQESRSGSVDYSPTKMLTRVSFWLFAIWAVLGQMSNVIVSSQARQSADEIMATGTIATMAVGVLHLFCSIGSVGFGSAYDRLGRKKTMLIENILLIVGALFFVISMKYQAVWAMVVGLVVLGITTGGLPSTNAAYIMEFYGPKYYASNYSIILLRSIPASFGAIIAASIHAAYDTYLAVYVAMLGMLVLSFVISFFIRKP